MKCVFLSAIGKSRCLFALAVCAAAASRRARSQPRNVWATKRQLGREEQFTITSLRSKPLFGSFLRGYRARTVRGCACHCQCSWTPTTGHGLKLWVPYHPMRCYPGALCTPLQDTAPNLPFNYRALARPPVNTCPGEDCETPAILCACCHLLHFIQAPPAMCPAVSRCQAQAQQGTTPKANQTPAGLNLLRAGATSI